MNEKLPDGLSDIVTRSIDELRQRLHYTNLKQRPVKEHYKSIDFLVESLCLLEQHAAEVTLRDPWNEDTYFLKKVLECNAPLLHCEQTILAPLGVRRDRKLIKTPNKHEIATQVIAQILWRLERCSSIQDVISYVQTAQDPVSRFFGFSEFKKKTLRGWLSPIYPVPLAIRRNPGVRKLVFMMEKQPIPSIFSEHGINFQKLRFAAHVAAQIFQFLGWSLGMIIDSQFVKSLMRPLPECLHLYIRDWVEEAYSNSCIFDQ